MFSIQIPAHSRKRKGSRGDTPAKLGLFASLYGIVLLSVGR